MFRILTLAFLVSISLIPPLVTDLAHLLLPHLTLLLTTLIRLTAPSPLHSANPHILQRVYDVLGALFRDLGRDILAAQSKEDAEEQKGGLQEVWEVVRRGLGAPTKPQEEDEEVEEEKLDSMEIDAVDKDAHASEDEDEEEEIVAVQPVASTSAQPITDEEPRITLYRTLPRNFRTTPQTRRLLGNSFSYLVRKAKPTSLPDSPSELSLFFEYIIEDVAEAVEIDGGERPRGRGAKGRGKGKGKGRGQEEGNSNIFAEGVTWVVAESCTVSFSLHNRLSSTDDTDIADFEIRLPTNYSILELPLFFVHSPQPSFLSLRQCLYQARSLLTQLSR